MMMIMKIMHFRREDTGQERSDAPGGEPWWEEL